MLSCSSDIGYMKLIEVDIETDPNLALLSQNHTQSLLFLLVEKQLEDLEKAGIIQRSHAPYASQIVLFLKKYPLGSPEHETKRVYRKLNVQLLCFELNLQVK